MCCVERLAHGHLTPLWRLVQNSTVSQSCLQDCLDFAERMKRKALRVRSEGSIPPYVTEAESRKQHSDAPLCNSPKWACAERSSVQAHRVRASGRTLVASACGSSDRNDGPPLYSRLEGAPTRAFGGGLKHSPSARCDDREALKWLYTDAQAWGGEG